MKTTITESIEETQALAEKTLKNLSVNAILLYGDLGAGKTTFTQGVGDALGIKRIISPTFILMREYKIPNATYKKRFSHFFHIDLYRTQTEQDLRGLGLQEILVDPRNLVVIEWAEKLGELLPKKRVEVKLEYLDEKKRKITIK